MKNQANRLYRHAALAALSFALAACGGDGPATRTGFASRSLAAVTADTTPVPVQMSIPEEYANALQHVYLAYFGRPAEPAGLAYWNGQLRIAGAATDPAGLARQFGINPGVNRVFGAFSASTEYHALYPGSAADFIDGVYRNLFNRSADIAGLAYWSNAIDKGILTRDDAAVAILFGAQGDDALGVRNKVAVSHTFYRLLTERIGAVQAYTGTRNNELARRMLAQVDAKTDLAAFEAVIRATVAQMELGWT